MSTASSPSATRYPGRPSSNNRTLMSPVSLANMGSAETGPSLNFDDSDLVTHTTQDELTSTSDYREHGGVQNHGIPGAPLQEDQYGHLHGATSEFAFLHFAKQKLTSLPSMTLEFCDYPLGWGDSLPRVLAPKEIADELVRTYFDFGLSTSRFVHEPSLCDIYSSCTKPYPARN